MNQLLDATINLISANTATAYLLRFLIIVVLTWLLANLFSWLAVRILTARRLSRHSHLPENRLLTLRSLVSGAMKSLVYVLGLVVILFAMGIPAGSILTTLGLFSAGFGFGARPLISDYLAGFIFIFEDQFAVGEKVEILEVIGTVESVNLRTTQVRSTTGELYIVPNGDVRVVRNLSRGLFSIANIKVTIATEDLAQALQILESVADTAQEEMEDLVERPEFLSEEGSISTHVELILSAKARYGRGARLRTRLMARVTAALNQAGVRIID